MKLLTFCSFKGGAGKTTALMGLCAAFASDVTTLLMNYRKIIHTNKSTDALPLHKIDRIRT
uniref:Uncharacterized protein n=1 Tax=Agrobacterium deltaense TaxID=1183412 RepID=A0A2Z2Q3U9_9HYPH|nr:hypothetical protein [Agrobacterium deltaense]